MSYANLLSKTVLYTLSTSDSILEINEWSLYVWEHIQVTKTYFKYFLSIFK